MWLDPNAPGCRYDTVDCKGPACGGCPEGESPVEVQNDSEEKEEGAD